MNVGLIFLLIRGANLNQRTETGMTPIMAAAINGDWEAVEFLMDRRAELDNKDLKDQSIVHLAAQYDQHELIENLLDHKRTERDFMVNENDQYVGSPSDIDPKATQQALTPHGHSVRMSVPPTDVTQY